MTHRINHALESHPLLGLFGSAVSIITGWFSWFMDHADDFTKLIGLAAAIFGMVAGYYTLRVQRRAWRRSKQADETDGQNR